MGIKGIISCMLGICLLTGSLVAQQYERRWALGAGVNFMDYAAPQGAKLFQPNNFDMGYYMSLQRYLTAAFRLSADVTYAYGVRFPALQGTGTRPALADMSYRLAFKFNNGTLLGERAIIAPYASVGIGGSYVKSHPDLYVPLGGGLNIRAGSRTSLRIEFTYKRSLNQDFQHFAHTAYLVYDLGKQKKFNPDPVPELQKPEGAWIALEAPDEDGDGIPDHYDRCPADPGSWAWQGCPGVPSGAPQDLAVVTDNAFNKPPKTTPIPQINTGNEEMSTKPKNQGQSKPISSNPTVNQSNKKPSFTDPMPGTQPSGDLLSKESNSQAAPPPIPTSGSEKVSFLDPVTPIPAKAQPNDTESPCAGINTTEAPSAPVYFGLGSAEITTDTRSDLDEMARMLQRCSNIRLEVFGHADALGSERNNQLLSVLRANAVKRYLVYQHGISLSRITCHGFGEQSPLSGNDTPEGRKRNRRVDFRW